jgi:hypothetical protein
MSTNLVILMLWYPGYGFGAETEFEPRLCTSTILEALYNYITSSVRLGAARDLVIGLGYEIRS